MKSVYLFLAATAAIVTCKPQRNNEDIIWYPVDEEDGVFVSVLGERYRTGSTSNTRSQRRVRSTGGELNRNFPFFPYNNPMGNEDPSFFHNIHERRHVAPPPQTSFGAPPFNHQWFPANPGVNWRPQSENYQELKNNNFHQTANEFFVTNKYPPFDGYSEQKSVTGNQWERPGNSEIFERPGNSEIFGRPGNSEIFGRPGNSEQFVDPNWSERPSHFNTINRPVNSKRRRKPNKSNTSTTESDKLVFIEETEPTRRTTTMSSRLPTEAPTLSPCERACPVTPEFNPVCGSDSVSYSNAGRLKCARMCGKDVVLSHYGNCGRTRLVTPTLSVNQRYRQRGNRRKFYKSDIAQENVNFFRK